MKQIYIIPGFGETTRFKNYRAIIQSLKKQVFDIIPVGSGKWGQQENENGENGKWGKWGQPPFFGLPTLLNV